jgi:low temperature requirement protein LtrA
VAVEVATPLATMLETRTLPLVSSHIAERFGLFTIIVLGESVVSVAAGIANRRLRRAGHGRARRVAGHPGRR